MKLQFPVNFIGITQLFIKSKHLGIDLGWSIDGYCGGKDQPVYAPYDGVVEKIVSNYKTQDKTGNSYGNYILIKHSSTYKTRVAHLKYGSLKVKKGDRVTRGQRIATMGTTGRSDGNHVHYEVYKNGSVIDPLKMTYYTEEQKIAKSTKSAYSLKKYPKETTETKTEPTEYKFEKTFDKDCVVKIKVYKGETLIIK